MKRSDSGLWGPPGGSTEPGERVEEAAKRETLEETGLEIGKMSLFNVFSGPELYYKYPNGDEVYNVTIVYLSRDFRRGSGDPNQTSRSPDLLQTVKINHEHTEYRWFARNEIPAPEHISPPIVPVIEQFKQMDRGKQ
jgi:8-oxo-dGTP pyrophosphatase MutT (NUDIX family)